MCNAYRRIVLASTPMGRAGELSARDPADSESQFELLGS